jgi:hypothetical protein
LHQTDSSDVDEFPQQPSSLFDRMYQASVKVPQEEQQVIKQEDGDGDVVDDAELDALLDSIISHHLNLGNLGHVDQAERDKSKRTTDFEEVRLAESLCSLNASV